MKKNYFAPITELDNVINMHQILGPSGDMGVSNTPADPVYPGGGD